MIFLASATLLLLLKARVDAVQKIGDDEWVNLPNKCEGR